MADFQGIIGHEGVISHLQKTIQGGKVSHAYILSAEEGMGKKSLAKAFAKTLQCKEQGVNPCGKCKSCMQMESGNQPDVIWVTHEKVSIGVEDIRTQVNGDIQIKPFESPYKIYIIDDAQQMTEAAQNALLKTLEEPPEYGILILLVRNINLILPTILSRCVVLDLKPVDKNIIKEYLMKEKQIPDYMAQVAADFSGGNVGKAIQYASSEEFEKKKEDVLHILRYIDEMKFHEIMSGLKTITENKDSIDEYIDFIVLWYRDILMLKATNDPNLLIYKNDFLFIKKQANTMSYEQINGILEATDTVKIRLKSNVNFDIALELMLLTIKENTNG